MEPRGSSQAEDGTEGARLPRGRDPRLSRRTPENDYPIPKPKHFKLDGAKVGQNAALLLFAAMALVNLFVLVQASEVAFSQTLQPYDFYVLLHAGYLLINNPTTVYTYQTTVMTGPYWSKWLWDGARYIYTPMFATFLAPISSLYPPTAKVIWESISYVLLVSGALLVTRSLRNTALRALLPILVFLMPIPVLYTNQTLPQLFGVTTPQNLSMWVSLVYYTDYYWGNTNTIILGLGLLSFYFAARNESVTVGAVKMPSYAVGSFLLALDSFKISALVVAFPFWLILNRRSLLKSVVLLGLFIGILNFAAIIQPALAGGYVASISSLSAKPSDSSLFELYDYVWYYTLPIVGAIMAFSTRFERLK